MAFVDILGNITAVLMIFLILSGIPTCINFQKNGSTGEISSIPFILGYFNSGLWLNYGYFVRIPAMFFVSVFGIIVNAAYIACYYKYSSDKATVKKQTVILTTILSFISIYSISIAAPEKGEWLAGFAASATTMLFIAAPLADLRKVITTKSTACLPTAMVFGNCIMSVLNLWYALLLNDLFMLVPNFIGTVISIIMVSLYVYYPATSKVKTK